MKVLRKIIQRVIKVRPVAVNMMFSEKVIIYQWIILGVITPWKYSKKI